MCVDLTRDHLLRVLSGLYSSRRVAILMSQRIKVFVRGALLVPTIDLGRTSMRNVSQIDIRVYYTFQDFIPGRKIHQMVMLVMFVGDASDAS